MSEGELTKGRLRMVFSRSWLGPLALCQALWLGVKMTSRVESQSLRETACPRQLHRGDP